MSSDASTVIDELTGAFIDVVIVDDPDGTPTETILGKTADSVTITENTDTEERAAHRQRRKLRKQTYNTVDVSLTSLFAPGVSDLQDLDLVDSNGDPQKGKVHDMIRLDVYDQDGDESPAEQVEFRDVEPLFDDHELGTSFSELSLTLWTHGKGPTYTGASGA